MALIQLPDWAIKFWKIWSNKVDNPLYRHTDEIKRWQLAANDSQGVSEAFGTDIAQEDYVFCH